VTNAPQYLIVARVLRPHGVRGDLRVQALASAPDRLASLDVVYMGRDPENSATLREHHIVRARRDKADVWLVQLEGVEDRDAADAFRNMYMLVSLADAVPLADDEVYLFQVMGLQVRTVEGLELGRVADIIETGANDVYVVRGELYGEVLLPAIDDVIVKIDVDNGVMIVRPMPGLLPE